MASGPGLSGKVELGIRNHMLGEWSWCGFNHLPYPISQLGLLPTAPWWHQPAAHPLTLPQHSLVAFVDCFEKQVCIPSLPCLYLPNPFVTALVQESGLREVVMNN